MRAVAELNDECDSPDCRQRGIDLWRKIESRLEAGSRDWLAARLEVCQSLRRLHKESDCRKLLGVTRLLYPEIEDHELRREFDQLAAELKGVDSP